MERNALAVPDVAEAGGVQKQPVPLPQLQLLLAVADGLVHPQRGKHRTLVPFIPPAAAHHQRECPAGVDIGNAALIDIQHPHQCVHRLPLAQVIELGVGVGHGFRQAAAHPQAAADRGLGHHHIEGVRDAAAGHLADYKAQHPLIQEEVVVEGTAGGRALPHRSRDGKGSSLRTLLQRLRQHGTADFLRHVLLRQTLRGVVCRVQLLPAARFQRLRMGSHGSRRPVRQSAHRPGKSAQLFRIPLPL